MAVTSMELTALERGKTKDDRDKWKVYKWAHFNEMDEYAEGDEGQSKNARVVWEEMRKEENRGLSFESYGQVSIQ